MIVILAIIVGLPLAMWLMGVWMDAQMRRLEDPYERRFCDRRLTMREAA